LARKKDNIELDLAGILKTARTSILAADREINEVLPEIETTFQKALITGKAFTLESFKL